MKVVRELLPGAKLIEPKVFEDARGSFVKTFHVDAFAEHGMSFTPREEYFSISAKDVVRGMHFQLPPHDHDKLVYCVRGRILDVLLDLRRSSATYGQAAAEELSEENRRVLFVPRGIAHGFLALGPESVTVYKTSTVHAPAHDAGIRWDSFGFDWGVTSPILSARDAAFPRMEEFTSPFA